MDYHNLYKEVENFVRELYEKNQTGNLHFHTLEHTEEVLEHAKEISAQYQLNEKEQFVLYSAAWFHDTGHLFTDPTKHEIKSVEIMKDFLGKYITDEETLSEIGECILSTRMPRNPQNILQQILCDADTYHLGTKDFRKKNKQLKKEYEGRNLVTPTEGWLKSTLHFIENHQYFTESAQVLLEEGKQKNVKKLKDKIGEQKEEPINTVQNNSIFGDTGPKKKGKEKEEDKKKTSLLSRGIQTMLRLTSDNHLELSNMADGKANILISVNSIIISVILSVLVRRLEVDTYLIVPTVIFLACSVTTIVIAILATRPKVSQGVFSREDIMNRKTNLLFFGNFHKASLEEYEWGMSQMMADPDYLYGALIKDIHQLGVVLGRKYKLLRIAYNVFMFGIIVSVLAFSLAVVLNSTGSLPSGNSGQPPL
ncbi:MAG TPA: Pycsar system effector family protein [Chitinophagaceae bacterium]|nr:Pycsar system effector family protein [Chitinophagaceae bacterium]